MQMDAATASRMGIEETFEDVKLLLWSTCHKFYNKYGKKTGTVEELFSVACLSFMNAYNKYQEGKASFATWVRWYVWHDLLELMRKDITRNASASIAVVDMVETDYMETEKKFSLTEFMDGLSDDAQYVVNLVINTPDALCAAMRRRGPGDGNTRLSIKQFLSGMDFTPVEISEVFSEIANALAN